MTPAVISLIIACVPLAEKLGDDAIGVIRHWFANPTDPVEQADLDTINAALLATLGEQSAVDAQVAAATVHANAMLAGK